MFVVVLLTILALVLPILILRPFGLWQKLFVLVIIVAHLAVMFYLHYRLVRATNYPIVVDLHVDTQKYYNNTSHFSTWRPFSITKEDAINATGGSRHYGYQYVLGTLRTITSRPMLAMRLLKTLLFFASLSCLTRVWRTNYGSRLAMRGFAFMAIVCTPVFYYNYRNLKDGLILALFIFIMALLDTVLRRREDRLHPMGPRRTALAWFAVIMLLYALSTIRLYTVALIVIAIVMHAIMASRLVFKRRILLLVILSVIVTLGFATDFVRNMMEMSGGGFRMGIFTLRGILQAFLSPIPWGAIVIQEPSLVPFYSIYWLLLPYALYSLFRHLRRNIDWHLFLYIMTTYVVGVVIGDPPRKRLIVYPILVTWVLAHWAYKRWIRAAQTEYDSGAELDQHDDYEYYEDDVPPGSDAELCLERR